MTDEEYDEIFNPPKPKEPSYDDVSFTRSIDDGLRQIRYRLMYSFD